MASERMLHDNVSVALNICVALLFAFRSAEVTAARPVNIAASLPALAVGAAVLFSSAGGTWSPLPVALLLLGAAITVVSLVTLGRSFAVLPGVREVVTRGPYQIVRHPAYSGELLMVAATALAAHNALGVALLFALVPLLALRIRAEERVLSTNETYRAYVAANPWRLCPGIW